MRNYYRAEMGFYGASLVMLLTWETRRKDFYVMLGHHAVTVALIGLSYITRCVVVGISGVRI